MKLKYICACALLFFIILFVVKRNNPPQSVIFESVIFDSQWNETEKAQITDILTILKEIAPGKILDLEESQPESLSDLFSNLQDDLSIDVIKTWQNNRKKTISANRNGRIVLNDIENSNKELISIVLNTAKSGKINSTSEISWTLLHLACAFNKKELAFHLIESKAPLNNISGGLFSSISGKLLGTSYPPLGFIIHDTYSYAFYNYDTGTLESKLDIIEKLVLSGADLNTPLKITHDLELSPFFLSLCLNHNEKIPLKLLELGAIIDKPILVRGELRNPLYFPVQYIYPEVCKKICESGVDPNAQNFPLLIFIIRGLLNSEYEKTRNQSAEILKILFQYGLDVNLIIPNILENNYFSLYSEETALTFLCSNKIYLAHKIDPIIQIDAIELFIRLGADINKTNKQGETPLISICRNMNENIEVNSKIMNLLLKYGADTNIRDKNEMTAMDWLLKNIFHK